MMDLDSKLLTIKEVLDISGVSRYTLYRSIKSGRIPAIHIGRNVRIKESDALKYAEEMGSNLRVTHYKSKDG